MLPLGDCPPEEPPGGVAPLVEVDARPVPACPVQPKAPTNASTSMVERSIDVHSRPIAVRSNSDSRLRFPFTGWRGQILGAL
jgi:hypothetical protein